MKRPFASKRPFGPALQYNQGERGKDFDTEIRYDILFADILTNPEKDVVEGAMEEAVSGRIPADKYQVVVADAGLQTAGIIQFSVPMSPSQLNQIHQIIMEDIREEDIATAQPAFIQSGQE